ncbi:MAG: hypothetical protein IPK57_12670 [Chitinophagaceae bacterium]|nr:hypothetical protein [Chitinophagaceae bacterium]
MAATSLATPVAASGITRLTSPVWALPYLPAPNTALHYYTGPGSTRYSGTGTAIAPNTFTGGGVNLKLGDVQIAGQNVGYGGSGTALTLTPRYFTGAITFSPAGPCTDPPVTGTVTASQNPVCLNTNFNLNLVGGTGGTGQTYQWQISPDNTTGPISPEQQVLFIPLLRHHLIITGVRLLAEPIQSIQEACR